MTKLVRVIKKNNATGQDEPVGWMHWCPGCKGGHAIYVEQPNHLNAKWSFDGNIELPTFGPSIRCFQYSAYEKGLPAPGATEITTCHYFIKAGRIEFCGDCLHDLKGQTVDLPPCPESWIDRSS